MEEIDYSILFRWFIGLSLDEPIWSPTTFSKNRDRLLEGDIASAFFDAVRAQAEAAGLLSDEHFTVDGTMLEAWASLKSFRPKDEGRPSAPPDDPGNPTVNFHGQARTNDTHASTTDPDARLYRKGRGKEAKLAYLGHVLLDNRHGLVANVCVTAATGTAEREAALELLQREGAAKTVGGDKNFDVAAFVTGVRALAITPHVAQKDRGSAIDGRTTRRAGYVVSQRKRKLVEQVFGWMKTVGGLRKLRHRGGELVDWIVTFTAAAYNLIRLRTLLAGA
jgi:IS5 family transposase